VRLQQLPAHESALQEGDKDRKDEDVAVCSIEEQEGY
jgi:hypothetical protein